MTIASWVRDGEPRAKVVLCCDIGMCGELDEVLSDEEGKEEKAFCVRGFRSPIRGE